MRKSMRCWPRSSKCCGRGVTPEAPMSGGFACNVALPGAHHIRRPHCRCPRRQKQGAEDSARMDCRDGLCARSTLAALAAGRGRASQHCLRHYGIQSGKVACPINSIHNIWISAMAKRHWELHRTARISWLRASVLGANDGIVSTASLVLGVAAAHATHGDIMVAGVAGLVAGAMSMAAGEYVSVHSQADTEKADLDRERAELQTDDAGERRELAAIYVARGLDTALAKQVADQLMAHDALGAHARDELGITEALRARPIQAALASAGSFAAGAVLPLVVTSIVPETGVIPYVAGT